LHRAPPEVYDTRVATFCLIHGQWHEGSCWGAVADLLRARGHEALAPDLPFDDPDAGYADLVRPALLALQGVPDPVIVVGHSRGSAEAALVAAERRPALLVYLCPRFGAFAAPPGAPDVFRAGFPFPQKDADGRSVWTLDAALQVMYPRLSPEAGRKLAARLRPGADPAGEYPLGAHPDVPAALIYATDDEFFTPEWEQFIARDVLGVEPIAIPTGHFPMVESPDLLADLFDRLASDAGGSG
jgi:pimeloyl-ACP methyl ester carboxylesterase